ncbi:stage II sporulation protein D [Bacillus sp. B1-b2]|uniref:stage II sporulation protein D n=1 Tax=Bacillus sp. B1-b2 TaxID=2653201 RepID=UPI0012628CF9|nr:stage II sporulation protein D [Bacillus sp. B1-b2]KAB7671819.1 stage II sporulation protein D [Bacillus sp. B1-b2]
MFKIKPIIVLGVILFVITLLVPTVLVLPFMQEKEETSVQSEPKKEVSEPTMEVGVYRESKEVVEKLDLEEYVVGVVASEMPAKFEMEALKAQALTARTYIVKRIVSDKAAELPEGAIVGDSISYQVYNDQEELKKIWENAGYDWQKNMKKIEEAVAETRGQILTFEGNPIDATFFSTSNGYTENSDDVWANSISYLQSVESPWDVDSPKFNGEQTISVKEFEESLGVQLSSSSNIMENITYTKGKRIDSATINGKELSGTEIREKLKLKSTDFTMDRDGDNIIVKTKGYGHGVGMSQYGANGMAVSGKTYEDIVKYYYKGVEVTASNDLLNTYTAKK